MRFLLCAALALGLSGCITDSAAPPSTPPVIKEMVPEKCKPELGPDPQYVDNDASLLAVPFPGAEDRWQKNNADVEAADQAAQNLFYRVKLYVAGRLQRIQRENELNAALKACKG